MKLIKDGETLEHIYSSHDRWLEDLDDFIKTEYCFSVYNNAIDLMDRVSAHLIFWLNDFDKEECADKVSDKILENKVLKRLTDLGETGGPELIIYEFGGTSIYDECNSGKIIYNEQEDLITIKLYENE